MASSTVEVHLEKWSRTFKQKRESKDSRFLWIIMHYYFAAFFVVDFFVAVFFAFFSSAGFSLGVNKARRFIRRPLRRAALLGWMTPFPAALSSKLTALSTASFVSGASAAKAVRAWLTAVRAAPRTVRLRRRRFSFWRFRLIWDLMLAKVFLQKTYFSLRQRCILHEGGVFVQ